MGLYGSPQLGIYSTEQKAKKKLSNPLLIVIDAVTLYFSIFFIGALTLAKKYPTISAVYTLLTFGLTIGLTVGFFGKIRRHITNRGLLLFFSITLIITIIIALLLG